MIAILVVSNRNTQYHVCYQSQRVVGNLECNSTVRIISNLAESLYQSDLSWCYIILCGSLVDTEVVNWSETCCTIKSLWVCIKSTAMECSVS